MTTTLDSLTDNEWTDPSDEIDNSSNLYVHAYADLETGSAPPSPALIPGSASRSEG